VITIRREQKGETRFAFLESQVWTVQTAALALARAAKTSRPGFAIALAESLHKQPLQFPERAPDQAWEELVQRLTALQAEPCGPSRGPYPAYAYSAFDIHNYPGELSKISYIIQSKNRDHSATIELEFPQLRLVVSSKADYWIDRCINAVRKSQQTMEKNVDYD